MCGLLLRTSHYRLVVGSVHKWSAVGLASNRQAKPFKEANFGVILDVPVANQVDFVIFEIWKHWSLFFVWMREQNWQQEKFQ